MRKYKARQAAQRQRQQLADDAADDSLVEVSAFAVARAARASLVEASGASLVEASPAAAPPAVPPLPLHRGLSRAPLRRGSSVAALAPDELLTVRALIEESDRTFHAMFAPKLPRSSKLAAEAAAAESARSAADSSRSTKESPRPQSAKLAAARESRRSELAAATKSGSLRLLALCDELIDTELHYFRELELLSEHFVRPLRAEAPELVQVHTRRRATRRATRRGIRATRRNSRHAILTARSPPHCRVSSPTSSSWSSCTAASSSGWRRRRSAVRASLSPTRSAPS